MATKAKKQEKTLEDLLLETLKDMYSAEKQILRGLQKMSKAANAEELREAFETHAEETEAQIERIEQAFESMDKPARAKTCEAVKGLIAEANEVAKEFKGSDALDAGLISAAQAVEHYEISRYGTMKAWAAELGMRDVAKLMEQTLQEEKKTDQLLNQLAEQRANQEAA